MTFTMTGGVHPGLRFYLCLLPDGDIFGSKYPHLEKTSATEGFLRRVALPGGDKIGLKVPYLDGKSPKRAEPLPDIAA